MDIVNIKLYYGGEFVTRKFRTSYKYKLGSQKYCRKEYKNVSEVAYFEIVDWKKDGLGFKDEGKIWSTRKGYSLLAGRTVQK